MVLGRVRVGASIGYLPAYAMSGTTSPRAILRCFLDMGGGEHIYGGFRLPKVFNLPFGFANAVAPSLPHSYGGLRWLLIKNHFGQSTLLALAAAIAMLGWIVWTLCRLVVVWSHLQHRQRLILSCCAFALVFDSFPLIFWDLSTTNSGCNRLP
jgi:hypothetical protein